MAENQGKGLGQWLRNLTGRASEAVANSEAALARGKIAGATVTDDRGQILIEAGQRIDDDVLARARKTGKVAALAASAMKAQTQDVKEKMQAHYARTEVGQEKRLLASVDQYREARSYLGRTLIMDVTDIRGNVIVPAGKELDDEAIRRARDADLLAALLFVAEQSPPSVPKAEVTPAYVPVVGAPRRAPTLLVTPDDELEE